MSLATKLKEAILSKSVEACVSAIIWMLYFVGNDILLPLIPYIYEVISKKTLSLLLLLSLVINGMLLAFVFHLSGKKDKFQLKYGIYWDKEKNPYCPACKTPLPGYDDYGFQGKGYLCKPCNKIFSLTDAHGRDISPTDIF